MASYCSRTHTSAYNENFKRYLSAFSEHDFPDSHHPESQQAHDAATWDRQSCQSRNSQSLQQPFGGVAFIVILDAQVAYPELFDKPIEYIATGLWSISGVRSA